MGNVQFNVWVLIVSGKCLLIYRAFLKLQNPEMYTGHSFRRTSARMLANSGASITNIKRHGGWKSASVAEGYLEDSLQNKKKIASQILRCVSPKPNTSTLKETDNDLDSIAVEQRYVEENASNVPKRLDNSGQTLTNHFRKQDSLDITSALNLNSATNCTFNILFQILVEIRGERIGSNTKINSQGYNRPTPKESPHNFGNRCQYLRRLIFSTIHSDSTLTQEEKISPISNIEKLILKREDLINNYPLQILEHLYRNIPKLNQMETNNTTLNYTRNSSHKRRYFLYPIPIQNKIIAPQKPYLILNEKNELYHYQEELCEEIENTFYCHNQLQSEEDCIVNIIIRNAAKNCSTVSVHLENIVTNQVSPQNILLTTPINTIITEFCAIKNHQELKPKSYLLTIPEKCYYVINQDKFSLENGNFAPVTIIQLPSLNISAVKQRPHMIKLNKMNVEDLSHLTKKMNHNEIVLPSEPDVAASLPLWLIMVICSIVCLLIYFGVRCYYRTRLSLSNSISQKETYYKRCSNV
ncbi:hypothetical protein NQ315_015478 [Exocentrus adspersus]|uniref:Tyr recombinase domain-containing protein n=1 Tax=Exocentrus adspersus TaxID=1586481 RepID=A0AAV8VNX0_9CUCU|nr:hypothetical protein NQ315_015478 [Exocentrus adspersus]